MAVGHFMMTFQPLFLWALATVAIGNGLFLPSLPSQIGDLYAANDPRRASAYTVYYVGKNVGAFGAPLVCGALGEFLGWHWGFAAAGIGMVIGVATYALNRCHLPAEPTVRTVRVAVPAGPLRAGGPAARYGPCWRALALAVVAFRAAYDQSGNTLARSGSGRDVDRAVAGTWTILHDLVPGLQPAADLPDVAAVHRLVDAPGAERRREAPRQVMKMGLGAMLLAVGLPHPVGGGGRVWRTCGLDVAGVVLRHHDGGANFSSLPIGLGLFARLAPPALAATTIALWYLTSFAGNLLAGVLGTLWSDLTPPQFFALIAGVSAVAAGLLFVLERPARRLEREADGDAARSGNRVAAARAGGLAP